MHRAKCARIPHLVSRLTLDLHRLDLKVTPRPTASSNVLGHLLAVVLLAVDVLVLELCLCRVVLGVTAAAVRWVEESRPPLPPHCRARRRCSQILHATPHKHRLRGRSAPFPASGQTLICTCSVLSLSLLISPFWSNLMSTSAHDRPARVPAEFAPATHCDRNRLRTLGATE